MKLIKLFFDCLTEYQLIKHKCKMQYEEFKINSDYKRTALHLQKERELQQINA